MVKKSLAIAFFLLAVAIALSVVLVIIAEDEDEAEGAAHLSRPMLSGDLEHVVFDKGLHPVAQALRT